MKVETFIYESTEIHFLLGGGDDVKINATEMAIPFNKKVENFTRIENTKAFIKAYIDDKNEELLNANQRLISEEDVLFSRKKSGTFMDRILALKFAAWLDPKFEVWVFKTIEKIKFSHYEDHLNALNAQQQEKLRFESLCRKAIYEQNELAIQIIESQRRLEMLSNKKRSALKQKNKEAKNLFSDMNE